MKLTWERTKADGVPQMGRRIGSGLFGTLLAGCAKAPSINVLGAYFPDWMFCISAAVVLCLALNAAARTRGWLAGVPGHLLAVAYAALATLFSLVGWLIFFHN